MFHCGIVDAKDISLEKAQKFIESHKCGAALFFIGTVRDHNNDKTVTGITYDSHKTFFLNFFLVMLFASLIFSATTISPFSVYHAGIWWPHQSCLEIHHGSIFSIH